MRIPGFVLLFTAVILAVHAYFRRRIVHDTALAPPWSTLATALLAVAGASLPASFFVLFTFGPMGGRWFVVPSHVWMGTMLFVATGFLVCDALRVLALPLRLLPGRGAADPRAAVTRARVVAVLVLGCAAVATGHALLHAREDPFLQEVSVELPGLPAALDGTTIVQLTDLHLGPTLGREWLERVVARVSALRPDLVAITGDLVDGSVSQLEQVTEPLTRLQARLGVFFVTGNHEYYSGGPAWVARLGKLGIKVLRNERVAVGSGAATFDLAGIDDPHGRDLAAGHGSDLERALRGRDPARALVLLAHQPRALEESSRLGVGLQISGHTHAGQIWPWTLVIARIYPIVRGLGQVGKTAVYVCQGTGFWGPPMRLGTSCEIARITLRSPRAAR